MLTKFTKPNFFDNLLIPVGVTPKFPALPAGLNYIPRASIGPEQAQRLCRLVGRQDPEAISEIGDIWFSALMGHVENLLRLFIVDESLIQALVERTPFNRTIWTKCFTHSSFDIRDNYEMLEYVGDRVAKYSFGLYLIRNYKFNHATISNIDTHYMSRDAQSELSTRVLKLPSFLRFQQSSVPQKIQEDLYEAFLGAIASIGNHIESVVNGGINSDSEIIPQLPLRILVDKHNVQLNGQALVHGWLAAYFNTYGISKEAQNPNAITWVGQAFDRIFGGSENVARWVSTVGVNGKITYVVFVLSSQAREFNDILVKHSQLLVPPESGAIPLVQYKKSDVIQTPEGPCEITALAVMSTSAEGGLTKDALKNAIYRRIANSWQKCGLTYEALDLVVAESKLDRTNKPELVARAKAKVFDQYRTKFIYFKQSENTSNRETRSLTMFILDENEENVMLGIQTFPESIPASQQQEALLEAYVNGRS